MKLLDKSIKLNLFIMGGIALVSLFLISWGLGVYTKHGEHVRIPELRGKQLDEAVRLLSAVELRCEVVDSVYDKSATPGSIIDVFPLPGKEVKPGRIIFLKIYAKEPPRISMPHVKDMSSRQAYALLRGMGFEYITQKVVTGEYIGLCQGVTRSNGVMIQAGELIYKDTPLVLLVTEHIRTDSIDLNELLESDSLSGRGGLLDSTDAAKRPRREHTNPEDDPESWW